MALLPKLLFVYDYTSMEDLNKNQLLLLCLLVSFVTSIASGIITTSLLREAPQNVTQTINRVVERTVETVAPQTTNTNTVTREVTVVVKEEDLVIDSIKKSRSSLVRIVRIPTSGSSAGQQITQTVGVITKSDGTVLTDKRFIDDDASYKIIMPGVTTPVAFKIAATDSASNAAYLTPVLPEGSPKTFAPMSLAAADAVQLGQTVIAVGGKDKEAVSIGRVNSIDIESGSTASSTKSVSTIHTDSPLRDTIPGSILLNLNGAMIGFELYDRTSGVESAYDAIGLLKKTQSQFFE
jgi:hypothetical protein